MNDAPRAPRQMQQIRVPSWIKNLRPFVFISLIVMIAAINEPPLSDRVAAPTAFALSGPVPIAYSRVFFP